MSEDLISRQAAIDVLDKIFPADPMRNDYTQGITCGAALAKEYIKQLPSARPIGKWELQEEDVENIYLCSNCRNYEAWGETEKTPYCPQCGAWMKGADDEEST